jgi:hypothetical protein
MPCFIALRRERDLPCVVRGPVDREALRRFDSTLRAEVGGWRELSVFVETVAILKMMTP